MSSLPEIRDPFDNGSAGQRQTVAGLAAECADFAERDARFLNGSRLQTGVEATWMTNQGILWKAGFLAAYYGEDPSAGQQYRLSLSVWHQMESSCEDLRELAKLHGQPLPDDEHIREVEITHNAVYTIGRSATLGWSIHREYEIHHDQSDIGPSFEELYDTDEPDEESEGQAGNDEHLVKSLGLIRHLAFRGMVDADEVPTASESAGDIFAEIETDVYLRQANEVFNILSTDDGEEDKFDLATIFPPEVLARLEQ